MLKISKMSGKLEGIPAVNTNTVTNKFCQEMAKCKNTICSECYSMNMLLTFRKSCQNAFEHNSKLLNEDIIPIKYLPFINTAFMRLSAHGELINMNMLINFVNLINKNSHCTFVLWTKRKDLINKYFDSNKKPTNLILIYSNAITNTQCKKPKYFDKVFNVYKYGMQGKVKINCSGKKCIDCMLCYTKNKITVINELIKNASGGKVKK